MVAAASKRRGCATVLDYLTSKAYMIAAYGAVAGVVVLFWASELVLPQHWVVYALLRLLFVGLLAAGAWYVYTEVLPGVEQEVSGGSGGGGEEEQSQSSAAEQALKRAQLQQAQVLAQRVADELLAEEEAAQRAAALAAEAKRAAGHKRKGGKGGAAGGQ